MPTASPLFIAEVSSNHQVNLQRCFDFIDTAARIGCGAVKFQLFKIDQLFAPEILARSEAHRQRKAWELPVEFLPELAQRCREQKIQFSCTPFYLQAVTELEPHVDFYKIASYELLWDELLQSCAATGKPVVLSTGMATLDEIAHAVQVLRTAEAKELTLLHCVSGYPAPAQDCNLAAIETLRNEFSCPVGWSDHSASPAVVSRAVNRWQADMVEFHLDLDGKGAEYAAGHCWLPDEIGAVISDAGLAKIADGSGVKQPTNSEAADRDWRADPEDGLRPLKKLRQSFSPDQ
jgi:N-acetylneuraminate synthase